MKLYKFDKLNIILDSLKYPVVTESRFKVEISDLTIEVQKGNIRWSNDGVYRNINGIEHKGYMYIKEYGISEFNNSFPRFHIVKCQTILSFINRGNFDHKYFWSNSNIVDVLDRETKKLYKNVVLPLCRYCAEESGIFNISNTQGFYDLLDIQTPTTNRTKDVVLDLDGYTSDWRNISKLYRTKVNFTCENCHIAINDNYDKRFLEVHHKNGDKLNNSDENIECLCVLCHSKKDKRHEENFSKGNNQLKIKYFVDIYKDQLIEVGNPFIQNYLNN